MLGFDSANLPMFTAPFAGEAESHSGGLELGTFVTDGNPLYLTDSDLRHGTLIAGRIGVGKSKLAEWLLRQILIRRSSNRDCGSTFVFDPHWSLAADVIDFAAACNLNVPIVTIDPTSDPIVAYDPIRSNPHVSPEVAADQFSIWMAHAWRRSDDDAAPLLESNLKLIVRTLLNSNQTLAHASALIDPDASMHQRADIVARIKDPVLKAKWNRLLSLNINAFMSQMGSASRALARLPARAQVLFGQSSSFSFRQAMDEGWFVFIRTSGEDGLGSTLASIMLDDLWNAVRSRGQGRSPVHVLIDEFTQLCGPHTVEMLNGGRKFDIRLILLMQSATQLKRLGESGRRAYEEIMLNCLNKICMSVDTASASSIADDLGTTVQRLTKLGRMHGMAHTPSMPPGVCAEIATRPLLPMIVQPEARRIFLAESLTSLSVPFVYTRNDALASLNNRLATAALPDVSNTLDVTDEPDEFTRVIRGTQ